MTKRLMIMTLFVSLWGTYGQTSGSSAVESTLSCRLGMTAEEIKAIQSEVARAYELPISLELEIGESVTIDCVLIPPGEFRMGSYQSQETVSEVYGGPVGQYDLEHPAHPVRITRPFYMGVTEITQSQWNLIMDEDPSPRAGDSLPVYCVSWDQGVEFCERLSRLVKQNCRLPTEAEWEYVCRSATATPFYFGDSLGAGQAKISGSAPTKVGSYRPRPWGVYDLHGNVREWVADSYGGYDDTLQVDPLGPPDHIGKMLRGGGFNVNGTHLCRCAWRYAHLRSKGDQGAGFRIVVEVNEETISEATRDD